MKPININLNDHACLAVFFICIAVTVSVIAIAANSSDSTNSWDYKIAEIKAEKCACLETERDN